MTTITTIAPQIDDSRYSAEVIDFAAGRIHQAYRELSAGNGVIALHALREALTDIPRNLLDATLRHLDTTMVAEVTEADDATAEDMAAAVWIVPPAPDEELAYWGHELGWITD